MPISSLPAFSPVKRNKTGGATSSYLPLPSFPMMKIRHSFFYLMEINYLLQRGLSGWNSRYRIRTNVLIRGGSGMETKNLPDRTIACLDMRGFYASCAAVCEGLDPLKAHIAVVG